MLYLNRIITFLIIVSLLFFSCKKEGSKEKQNSSIIVELKKSTDENINYFDTGYIDFHFKSYYLDYPKYYDNLLHHNGLPKVDTFLLVNYYYDNQRFFYDLFKKGYINDSIFAIKIKNYNIDTTYYSNFKVRDGLTAFVGLKGKNQILILDENRNMDFSDDTIMTFNRDSVQASKISLKKNLSNFNYDIIEKGALMSEYKRKISIYPSPEHPYTNFFDDSLNKELHIMGKFRDYWKGSFEYESSSFEVFCQGFKKDFFQILIKPNSIDFKKNVFFNKNFEYHIKDTIAISNDIYRLDSIDNAVSNLYLTKIQGKKLTSGFRMGQTLGNIKFNDLKSVEFRISELGNKKKYILLDFWGTWCNPCKKTLPQLKVINDRNKTILDIVSIAFDEDIDHVADFVDKNEMKWSHAYIKRKYDAPIINQLRIEVFPTFILIDQDHKIILRDSGVDGLNEIKDFLDKENRL